MAGMLCPAAEICGLGSCGHRKSHPKEDGCSRSCALRHVTCSPDPGGGDPPAAALSRDDQDASGRNTPDRPL